jgi:hypothetical protein
MLGSMSVAMKIRRFILLSLLLGYCAVSAQTTNAPADTNTPPLGRHLTEAQVLALAKPVLGHAGDDIKNQRYHTSFTNGTWEVSTYFSYLIGRPGQIGGRVVTIRDLDGKMLGMTNLPMQTTSSQTNRDSPWLQGHSF